MDENRAAREIRPYQLMCIVCRSGDADRDERLDGILQAVREDPNRPLTLRCNVDSAYRYQNPGREEDSPEGDLFNEKRDLDLLQRLGLVPGDTRPAVELFERLFREVPESRGICGYDGVTADHWRGCDRAESGAYERGIAAGLQQIVQARDEEEKGRFKRDSVDAMYRASELAIRPHHLMCMACFHGGREELEPIAEDNLFEAIDIIQKNPDIPVRLVRGCCEICPPCSRFDAESGLCGGGVGMNLRDQKKDLDVLQLLGLAYGDRLPARRLYGMLFERIPSTRMVCGYGDGVARSAEWSVCRDPKGSEAYARARECDMGI
ncbi:MAG: hypothetical protein HOC74_36410 [Gemmatimonadetes bacterium]|jgi:hypothetical protein|nr:hypothetical protein [Gemmatimonadota bacterium]